MLEAVFQQIIFCNDYPLNMVTLLLTDESLSMVTQANQNLSDYQNSYVEPLTEVFLHKNRYSADII